MLRHRPKAVIDDRAIEIDRIVKIDKYGDYLHLKITNVSQNELKINIKFIPVTS